MLTTLKGLPLSYNRDLQEDKEPLFAALDEVDRLLPALSGLIGSFPRSISRRWRPPPTLPPSSPSTWRSSWSLVVFPSKAHRIVGALVRRSLAGEGSLRGARRSRPATWGGERRALLAGLLGETPAKSRGRRHRSRRRATPPEIAASLVAIGAASNDHACQIAATSNHLGAPSLPSGCWRDTARGGGAAIESGSRLRRDLRPDRGGRGL